MSELYISWVKDWINELVGTADLLEVIEDDALYRYIVNLYSAENIYRITSLVNDSGSYLGCTVTTRKQRPGENWSRGRDLPDGNVSKKTWDNIRNAIIRYELEIVPRKDVNETIYIPWVD